MGWRVLVVTALLALAPLTSVPAAAVPPPPPNPSDDELNASRDQATAAAAEAGRLAGLVARTEGDIQRLQDRMELQMELANKAAVDLQVAQSDAAAAQAAATSAQSELDAAGQAVEAAEGDAAAFAAASFRQGSVLGSMTALLDAGSPTDLLGRRELLDQMSGSVLNAVDRLHAQRIRQANLTSEAGAARDNAAITQTRAEQAKATADQAAVEADQALGAGQAELAVLQGRLEQQQSDYASALAAVDGLQQQREQFQQWLAQKQAEEEAARRAAEEAARKAAEEAARQAAERAAAEEAARQATERAAAEEAARQAAEEAARQVAERAAAEEAARIAEEQATTARAAQVALTAEPFYATCDAARAAGRGPITTDEPGYRPELDPNDNGIACEGPANPPASAAPAPAPVQDSGRTSDRGQRVVDAALRWLGTTYAWGGGNASGPTLGIRDGGVADRFGDYKKIGFDCSGLTLNAWAQVGVSLPHYSAYQYAGQPKIGRDELQAGDLVFWAYNTSDPTTIHHVAIWMGNGRIVEARNSGTVVKVSSMNWDGYIGAVRPGG